MSLRPLWINITNFIGLLNCPSQQEDLAKKFAATYWNKKYGFETDSQEEDSKKYFPVLLRDLRIYDITDDKYWSISFIGVQLFLLVEAMIFLFSDFKVFTHVALFMIILAVIISLFSVICNLLELEQKWKINVHTWQAIIISCGLLIINYILITKTGWRQSPFLPAFTFVALTIITAPRENSKIIIILSLFAMTFILFPYTSEYIFTVDLNQNISASFINKYDSLSRAINIVTLVFSVLIVIANRFYSSQKVIK